MDKTKNVGDRKLVVLSGNCKGTTFVLRKTEVNAGRESDNAICLKGKRVSRYHAVLIRTNGEYTLRDVSPQIGTLLNGRRTKEKVLKLGDRIRIGEFEMSYEAAAVVAPVIESPAIETPAPVEEVAVPQEPVVDLAAEYQQRIAEMTLETERLVGELKLANEGLESLRAQLRTQSEQQAELTERLGAASQENVALMKLNGELQAKISAGEVSTEMAHRVEGKLTRETERLVGEVKLANEALESMRAELQTQSEQRADLTERLGGISQEKAALAGWNEELRAKVSELEASTREMNRMETALAVAQIALSEMSADLVKLRESAKLDAKAEPVNWTAPLPPARSEEKLESVQTAPAEALVELGKGSDRIAPAVLSKRDVSDPTNEQFDKIRRSIVEKKSLQKPKTMLERFMLPFRDTSGIS